MQAVAFCPGHITGFFKAEIEQVKPELQGSIGAGFCIKEGVTTKVRILHSDKPDFKIKVTGYQSDNTQVSEFVISEFFNLCFDFRSSSGIIFITTPCIAPRPSN